MDIIIKRLKPFIESVKSGCRAPFEADVIGIVEVDGFGSVRQKIEAPGANVAWQVTICFKRSHDCIVTDGSEWCSIGPRYGTDPETGVTVGGTGLIDNGRKLTTADQRQINDAIAAWTGG